MPEEISVEKAISRGHRMVTIPGILIMFGIMGLTALFGLHKDDPVWILPVGLSSSILISWLFWSVQITKWKVWAFSDVRNVHELKKRAIQGNLTWKDNSIFTKTEIWSSEDRLKWELLQNKFLKKDEIIFENNLTVPSETTIYYSKGKNLVEMIIMLLCVAFGIYLIIEGENYLFGWALILFGSYFAFKEFKEATNKTPQIILSDKGIQTIHTRFYNWQDINNEDVDIQQSGKNTNCYLTYGHKDGVENLLIDDYDTDYEKLRKLLRIYRGRSLATRKYR